MAVMDGPARNLPRRAQPGAPALLDLMEALLAAPDDARLGAAVLDTVGALLAWPSRAVYLFASPGDRARCIAAANVSELFLQRYERDGRERDPVLAQALATGRVACNADLMTAEQWRSTEAPRVAAHIHRFASVAIAPVIAGGRVAATINVGDDAPDRIVTGRDRDVLALIARTTGIALAHRARDARLQASAARATEAFHRAPVALAITTPAEDRPIANAAAAGLLSDLADPDGALYEALARSDAAESVPRVVKVRLTGGGQAELLGVSRALAGEPGASVTALERADRPRLAPALGSLTRREREVVLLVAEGLTDGQVAQRLGVSPHTVGQHLKRAYRKLDVRSRVELARLVMLGA